MRYLLRGDKSEEEVQRRLWRGPRVLFYCSGHGEAANKRFGLGGFTLSNNECWGSGTTAIGPAWWRPLDVVRYVFSLLLIDVGLCFRQRLSGQEKVGSHGNFGLLGHCGPTVLSVFVHVDAPIQSDES